MKGRTKNRTIFQMVILPLIVLLVIQLFILIGIPMFSGVLKKLDSDAEDIFRKQIENRSNYIENMMVSNWSQLDNLSEEITNEVQNQLDAGHLTLEQLSRGEGGADSVVTEIAEEMVDELYTKKVSGIFAVFLPECKSGKADLSASSKYNGICFFDANPNSALTYGGESLVLKCGSVEAAQNESVGISKKWNEKFEIKKGSEYYDTVFNIYEEACEDAYLGYTANYGYWNIKTEGEDENASKSLTYSMPLILEDGTVYGVIGVELADYCLCNLLPSEELDADGRAVYVLANAEINDEEITVNEGIFSSRMMSKESIDGISNMDAENNKEKWYTCRADDKKYSASADEMYIYADGVPFAADKWIVMGVVENSSLYSMTTGLNVVLGISVLLLATITIVGSVYISKRLSKPVHRLYEEVFTLFRHKDITEFSRTNIEEIDLFAQAIEELNEDVYNASARFIRIIEMSSMKIGGFEIKNDGSVFVTDSFFELIGIDKEKIDVPVNPEEFKERLNIFKAMEPYRQRDDGSNIYEVPGEHGNTYVRIKIVELEESTMGLLEDVTAITLDRNRIEYERDYDVLTGLLNRRAFYRKMDELFGNAEELGYGALVMLDLDNLKQINDRFGHEWGDQYIQQAVRGYKSAIFENSVLARLAGDEFVLFLYGFKTPEDVREALEAFEKHIHTNMFIAPDGEMHRVYVSGGISWYPQDSSSYSELMKYADFAMYRIKNGQKGNIGEFDFESYNEESFLTQSRKELEMLIDEEMIQYHFQPIFEARTGKVAAYEALMRVNMPTLRTPDSVINLATDEGRLDDIERLTMLKSTEFFAALIDNELVSKDAYLFVNSLADRCIDEETQIKMKHNAKDFHKNIVLEITEFNDMNLEMTGRKRKMDCFSGMFALDDYGSGYNSDKMLLNLMPEFIKIDMSLIRGIDTDRGKQRIVSSMMLYAHERNIKVVCEGVESEGEIRKVLELGTDYIQGYGLARPAAIPENISEKALDAINEFNYETFDEEI